MPERSLSAASTLASMTQELSQSFGAALAALVLQTVLALRGGAGLAASDMSQAFLIVGLLSLLAIPFFRRLPRDAGDAVSGRRVSRLPSPEPAE